VALTPRAPAARFRARDAVDVDRTAGKPSASASATRVLGSIENFGGVSMRNVEFCEPDMLRRDCRACDDTGIVYSGHDPVDCPACLGSGDEYEDVGPAARNIAFALGIVAAHIDGVYSRKFLCKRVCFECSGRGYIDGIICIRCNGCGVQRSKPR
jgi:hypothetical protein